MFLRPSFAFAFIQPNMPKLSNQLLGFLRRRTFAEKMLLVLIVQQIVYQAFEKFAGIEMPLEGLLNLVFFALAFLIAVKYLFRLFRRTVWRLRNRLILAYVFIGVVPITLISVMLGLGMYILMGQVATYLMTAELNRRNEVVRDCAYALAWNVADHLGSDQGESAANQFIRPLRRRLAGLEAVVRVDGKTFQVPKNAGVSEFPRWSQHGFLGLVAAGREYALAADVRVEQPFHRVEVFAYESADASLLGNLLPGMASISLLAVDDDSSNDLGETDNPPAENIPARVRFRAVDADREEKAVALQPPRSWWDITVRWGTPFPVRAWEGSRAKTTQVLVRVVSRPSLIIQKLFSTLGPLTGALRFLSVHRGRFVAACRSGFFDLWHKSNAHHDPFGRRFV